MLLALLAVWLVLIAAGAQIASASAAAPLEEVWSFNGGQVAIQAQPGGTFLGTVIAPTKFATCAHLVGEQMWTGLHLQPDGSYWGLHQWYFESPACTPNPRRGPTAWRIMEAPGGGHYLLVCFSSPGGPQPTIAPSGAEANVTYGCRESAPVAPVPSGAAPASRAGARSFKRAVTLPSTRACFSRRVFRIHLQDPRYDPLKEVVVTVAGRKVAVLRRGKAFTATINLTGLPRGTFTVRIHLTTVLGHRLSGSRTYHTCVRRISTRSRQRKPVKAKARKRA